MKYTGFDEYWAQDGLYGVKDMEQRDDHTAPSREDAEAIARAAWDAAIIFEQDRAWYDSPAAEK